MGRFQIEHPTTPVGNVALTKKAYRIENTSSEWDDGEKIGIKNK